MKKVRGEGLPLLEEDGAKEQKRLKGEELKRRETMAKESNESGVQAIEVREVA